MTACGEALTNVRAPLARAAGFLVMSNGSLHAAGEGSPMDFAFLVIDWLGKPVWMWLGFLTVVVALLVFDLGVLHRENREIEVRESLVLSSMYIALGLAFGGFVWWQLGSESGLNYLTGFVVEKTLALDNVFVIALIFSFFAVPRKYQHRVLFWGILGVIVLRAIMIGLGATLVSQFSWVLYVFAAFLIITGIKMLWIGEKEPDIGNNPIVGFLRRRFNVTDQHHGEAFFVRKANPVTGQLTWFMTPLFMALVMVEIADVIFAVDSVPAIFAITTDPFIVYTSNIFAILGLRALYFALAAMIHRFRYLKPALAIVLIFIGSKIFVADLLGLEKFPATLSLSITFAIIGSGVVWSLIKTRPTAPFAGKMKNVQIDGE
ncbi:TerC family protein [Fulvimarina pelagi HTCC2506]|uniref:TerC family protein n=2 Tax=Fulvimarina pelagi TaxID=217511 RepID=Q0FYJ9_9HYPH|nr:TerC family protein [Fulvimarina pelagi HTCC2506]